MPLTCTFANWKDPFGREIEKGEAQFSAEQDHPVSLPVSDEFYLFRRYRRLILSNRDNLVYHTDARMDAHFRRLMNTYDYEDALFRIEPRLRVLREMKEEYIRFNTRNAGLPTRVTDELEEYH